MSNVLNGVGVGLRSKHYDHIAQHKPALGWLEALADNYLQPNSVATERLLQFREDYPIALHSVGMSIGASQPLNKTYFDRYKQLIDALDPAMVSDHLCWVSDQEYLHELLPLPYTQEALDHVVLRIEQIQDWLQRPIAIENISSYLQFSHSSLPEWDFLNQLAQRTGCRVLVDINNLYVNANNHGCDALEFIEQIDATQIAYLHLAGYEDCGTHLLDTHGTKVADPVWALYQQAVARFGAVPTLIEWDSQIPAFEVLLAEARTAQTLMEAAL